VRPSRPIARATTPDGCADRNDRPVLSAGLFSELAEARGDVRYARPAQPHWRSSSSTIGVSNRSTPAPVV